MTVPQHCQCFKNLTMTNQEYIDKIIVTNFKPLVTQNFYSSIINTNYEIIICTNLSARAFGFDNWEEMVKFKLTLTMYNAPKVARAIFQNAYTPENAKQIHEYVHRLFLLQEYVFTSGKIVSYIDMLPYNNQLRTYLVTFTPLYYQGKEIVALQTFSSEINLFRIHDHLILDDRNFTKQASTALQNNKKLTKREEEVMFLISNNINQEQCAQILGITRNTIATIIRNLCAKFDIAGASTKALYHVAIEHGFFQTIPDSLWKPCIIVTDQAAVDYIGQKLSK